MSRFRLSSMLAVAAGILITTGGCTASPTGTEAGDASLARSSRVAPTAPTTPPVVAPTDGDEEMSATLSSGYMGTGTRQDEVAAP